MAFRSPAMFLAGLAALAAGCSAGGPEIQFVDTSTTETVDSSGNFSLRIDCRIRNIGDEGDVTVTADLDGLGGQWTESETAVLTSSEERTFSFRFTEVSRQAADRQNFEYSCTAETG